MSNFTKPNSGVLRGTEMALTDLPSISNDTFLGNISGSAATPSALTATQVTANLNLFTASLQGLVPGSGGGTANFLRADGTWDAPGGTSPLTTKGDIYTFSTVNARQPVPSDYGRLIPDSIQTTGWRDASYTQIQQGRPGKNYIQYADFENNSTTGWTLGTIGTLTNGLPTGSPTFGSGASGNLSIAATSSSIEGAYSLNYVSSAATTAGNMVASSSYAIDAEDQAKVLTIKFYYTAASGASNCNFSGTSSNSFAWALYDVTNSSWLSSAGNFNLIQSSGCGYVTGTCQTNATTANIRLCVYNANATSGAATLTLDGFYVGPQTAPSGPAVGDTSTSQYTFTPGATPFGSVTNNASETWRVGDRLHFNLHFTSGTTTANPAAIALPSGLSIDSTKMYASHQQTVGTGNIVAGTNSLWVAGIGIVVFFDGSDTGNIYISYEAASNDTLQKINANGIVSSGEGIQIRGSVPITGWSSNSVMSSDTDTRVVAARYTGATATITSSYSNVTFTTQSVDTHGAYSGATYTVPVAGIYDFGGQVYVSGTASLNGTTIVGLSQNSSTVGENDFTYAGAITGSVGIPFNFGSIPCKAGDTIVIQVKSSITLPVITSSSTENFFQAARRSGPAVITATDTTACEYNSTAGNNVANSTITYIDFGTKESDSTNSVLGAGSGNVTTTNTGWRFVAPVSGRYRVEAQVTFSFTGGPGQQNQYTSIYINGVEKQRSPFTSSIPSGTFDVGTNVAGTSRLLAGDRIEIVFFQTGNGTRPLSTSTGANRVSILRDGNY